MTTMIVPLHSVFSLEKVLNANKEEFAVVGLTIVSKRVLNEEEKAWCRVRSPRNLKTYAGIHLKEWDIGKG